MRCTKLPAMLTPLDLERIQESLRTPNGWIELASSRCASRSPGRSTAACTSPASGESRVAQLGAGSVNRLIFPLTALALLFVARCRVPALAVAGVLSDRGAAGRRAGADPAVDLRAAQPRSACTRGLGFGARGQLHDLGRAAALLPRHVARDRRRARRRAHLRSARASSACSTSGATRS